MNEMGVCWKCDYRIVTRLIPAALYGRPKESEGRHVIGCKEMSQEQWDSEGDRRCPLILASRVIDRIEDEGYMGER